MTCGCQKGRTDPGGTMRLHVIAAAVALLSLVPAQAQEWRVNFGMCGRERVTCVVDGDTIWLQGVNLRLESYDTPEPYNDICGGRAEVALAKQASARLLQLLNGNPFTVEAGGEDRYGRVHGPQARRSAGSAGCNHSGYVCQGCASAYPVHALPGPLPSALPRLPRARTPVTSISRPACSTVRPPTPPRRTSGSRRSASPPGCSAHIRRWAKPEQGAGLGGPLR